MRNIFAIIFIGLSIAGLFIYIKPLYDNVKTLQQDIKDQNLTLSQSKELQEKSDSLITSFGKINKQNMDRLDKFLPDTVNNIQLILQLQSIAEENGVSIKNVDFAVPTVEEKEVSAEAAGAQTEGAVEQLPYGIFDLEFKTQARYGEFVYFLEAVEKNLRLIDVRSISFTIPPRTRTSVNFDPDIFEYTVKIQTYWLK